MAAPLALLALAACGETGADADIDMGNDTTSAAATPEPVVSSMAPPTRDTFAEAYAEACPDAEAVNNAVCKAQGMGAQDFTCDYGLGEDEYNRNTATLTAQDGEWIIAEPSAVCDAA